MNTGRFVKGQKRSRASIEKQRATLRKQYAPGGPRHQQAIDMAKKRAKKIAASVPIGTVRLHDSGRGCVYREVKVAERGRWKYEHRIVAEETLGRPLTKKEIVHHINGNTLDNRPENLEVTNRSRHTVHHCKLSKWAKFHDSCRICHKAHKKHYGRGVCTGCAGKKANHATYLLVAPVRPAPLARSNVA